LVIIVIHSQKKRYKSCHWGCAFSKGKLLSIYVLIWTFRC